MMIFVPNFWGLEFLVQDRIPVSFRTQTPIQFLRGSFSKWFLSGLVPRGSRIPVRIDS